MAATRTPKANRIIAMSVASSGDIAAIAPSHRLTNQGDPQRHPPPVQLPSGVYALWTGMELPPLPCEGNFPQAPDGWSWRVVGSAAPPALSRIALGPSLDQAKTRSYRYQVQGTHWIILQVENAARAHQDQEQQEEDDSIMELDEILPERLFGQKIFNDIDGVADGEFRNLLVHGEAKVLSDESTKSDIENLNLTNTIIEKFLKIRVVSFKNKVGDTQIGFSAQNLALHFPNLVSTVMVDGDAKLAVKPIELMAMLLLIVQGQQILLMNLAAGPSKSSAAT